MTTDVSAKVLKALKLIIGIRNLKTEHEQRATDIQVSHYPACRWERDVVGIVEL